MIAKEIFLNIENLMWRKRSTILEHRETRLASEVNISEYRSRKQLIKKF